ncbi:hypothetical protein Agub_g13298 [Astrephomene gubernaculifera]|uniref:Uncharacterized protein n=1 Tax=Astrephomene gubernaculifera TaxID=47775 RepID=A0AAD3HRC3_9CHLO|nr:hypothetical protein Agub_g13298 [Astrephomene gubernaculifera]
MMSSIDALHVKVGTIKDAIQNQSSTAEAMAKDIKKELNVVAKFIAQIDMNPMPAWHIIIPAENPEDPKRLAWLWWHTQRIGKEKYRLHLLCEHHDMPHLTDHPGYELQRPREFLRKYEPVLRVGVKVLSMSITMALSRGGQELANVLGWLADHYLDNKMNPYKKVNVLLDELRKAHRGSGSGGKRNGGLPIEKRLAMDPQQEEEQEGQQQQLQHLSPSELLGMHQLQLEGCQEARREIWSVLQEHDPTMEYGNLQKVYTVSGDVLWLCKHHVKSYRSQGLLRE